MGSSGIKRRKPRRPLPKVRGQLPRPEPNAATALSPMGAIHALGDIGRAATSADKRQRRAGRSLWFAFALPLVIVAISALVFLATR